MEIITNVCYNIMNIYFFARAHVQKDIYVKQLSPRKEFLNVQLYCKNKKAVSARYCS